MPDITENLRIRHMLTLACALDNRRGMIGDTPLSPEFTSLELMNAGHEANRILRLLTEAGLVHLLTEHPHA